MMKNKLRKLMRTSSGQTLLLGVISLVIIVVGILLLFDVHTVIRGKMKSQTAVDAAAIAGANWQMHSLNLIGELNLIKACNVLISDPLYGISGDPDEFAKMKEANEYESIDALNKDLNRAYQEKLKLVNAAALLTQMQTRVAFVGPLVGYGAAQQAAKNNGLNYNRDAGDFDLLMLDAIRDDDIYGDTSVAQVINDFEWRIPYASMLENILDIGTSDDSDNDGDNRVARGIAVGTKVLRLGTPNLYTDPPAEPDFTSYLTSRSLYSAIESDYWCVLKDILRMSYSAKWWGEIRLGKNQTFIGSSEILPLHVRFFKGTSPYNTADETGLLDRYQQQPGREDLVKLGSSFDAYDPYQYDKLDNGDGTFTLSVRLNAAGQPIRNSNDTDLKFNILPDISWATYDEYWVHYDSSLANTWESDYLAGSFKPGVNYSSGALSYFISRQSTKTVSGNIRKNSNGSDTLGGALDFHGKGNLGRQESRFAQRMSAAEYNITESPRITTDALAKPFGSISVADGSNLAPFQVGMLLPVFEKTALIPVSLEPVYGMSSVDYDWYLFISKFLPALGESNSIDEAAGKLDARTRSRTAWYAQMLKKLDNPEWRQKGIQWLKAEATGHNIYDINGKFISHVTDTINEDHCNDWPSGGGGGGTRYGPGKLH